jgi:hypothetical protein
MRPSPIMVCITHSTLFPEAETFASHQFAPADATAAVSAWTLPLFSFQAAAYNA